MTTPSPEKQVEFLAKIQRLLAEGGFVSTYKHALLLALADLAVEHGDDTGASLAISVDAIAEKVILYYWRQALPFPGTTDGVLQQNAGRQAEIVRRISEAQRAAHGSLVAAKTNRRAWKSLVGNVSGIVRRMPLWRLQRVGDEVLDFLYPNKPADGRLSAIELRPGVAYCFRRFHGLIEELVRGAWVRFVRDLRDNQRFLGPVTSLDEFLFGSERADLSTYRPILMEVQSGRCFYCKGRLDHSPVVDHFIPWSRYPVDLGHNFVLAHGNCNGKKADRLASAEHLDGWCSRNLQKRLVLDEAFVAAKVPADLEVSIRITRWAYAQIEASRGLVWVSGDVMVPLGGAWRTLLEATEGTALR